MFKVTRAAPLVAVLGLVVAVNMVSGIFDFGKPRVYTTRCLFNGRPVFKGSVDVHFFNNKHHSAKNFGCGKNQEFRFNMERSVSNNYNHFQDLVLDDKSIKRDLIDCGNFDPEAETFFFIHGYQAQWNSDPDYCRLKDLVLTNQRANFFLVDWSSGANPDWSDYGQAVVNTEHVGKLLGRFISSLIRLSGQKNADSYHLAGFGMGAQIAGLAGYNVGKHRLGRITALDPAGPCFNLDSQTREEVRRANELGLLPNNKLRLSAASAKLVVALHTDAVTYGIPENVGHYDVFVNGGVDQPPCVRRFNGPLCSHTYANRIVDTFASLMCQEPEDRYTAVSVNATRLTQCFPMAYTCRSWNGFRAGECGSCRAGDTNCIHLGIGPNQQGVPTSFVGPDRGVDWKNYHQLNEDRRFNHEDPEITWRGEGQLNNIASRPATYHAIDRQYIILDDWQPTCRYSYQVVVATSDAVTVADSMLFYLQLHIGRAANLINPADGRPLRNRLVRISNSVHSGSLSHARLSEELQVPHDKRATTTYHTALITFGRNEQTCGTNIDVVSEGWQLHRPLTAPLQRGARIWGPDSRQLSSVQFVALNYMSGLTEAARYANSFLVKAKKEVVPKSKISAESRPTLLKFKEVNDWERNTVENDHLRFTVEL